MEYKIIRDEQGFLAEKEMWNGICNSMVDATPFQTWEWNYIWWKNNEPADSLYVIKAYEGKTVFGYAPIVVKNNTAEFIGCRDMDYGLFVVAKNRINIIQGFLEVLLNNKIQLWLQEMPSRSSQLHIIQKFFDKRKMVLYKRTTRASYVDIHLYQSFEEYFKLLSQSMRNKTIKTGLKKGLVIQKEVISDALFNDITAVYTNRQDVRGGAPDISWSFNVIRQMNENGLADVYVARNQDEAVGFLVSLKYNKSNYIWLVAFKMEYRDCFPGQLLFYSVIKDGFEHKDEKVDFMRGDYDFKMRWECALDTNYSVYVYNRFLPYFKDKLWFSIRPKIRDFIYGHERLMRFYKRHV